MPVSSSCHENQHWRQHGLTAAPHAAFVFLAHKGWPDPAAQRMVDFEKGFEAMSACVTVALNRYIHHISTWVPDSLK